MGLWTFSSAKRLFGDGVAPGALKLVSSSVSSAAEGTTRWYALLVGVPILFYVTRSVLRVMIGAHRLVWTDLRERAPKPTIKATAIFLCLLLAFFALTTAASALRASSFRAGLIVSLLLVVPYAGFWLLISMRLPHRTAGWMWLVPGALLFGVGIELIQLVVAYFIAPYTLSKQGTYGALGIAAGLLLGLFYIARLMVGNFVAMKTRSSSFSRACRSSTAMRTSPKTLMTIQMI